MIIMNKRGLPGGVFGVAWVATMVLGMAAMIAVAVNVVVKVVDFVIQIVR